jgi:hypothetical protein
MMRRSIHAENLYQNPSSQRWAILEDDGTSGWLYLTEPDSRKPTAWFFNRIPAPPSGEISRNRGGQPPAAQGFAKRCRPVQDARQA